MNEHRPLFIVVEGLDGSGKSTQIELLRDRFQSLGHACHLTAEPTDLPTGRLIRSILQGETPADMRSVAALFAADRLEHIFHGENGLLAQLANGYHVIASRYYFSSLAYQSEYANPGWIAALNAIAKQTLPADLTLFLDLPPEISLRRINQRGEDKEIFESTEKLTHVRESFKMAFEQYGGGERIRHIDASGSVEEVGDAIWDEVNELLVLE